MKKKWIVLMMALALTCMSVTACNGNDNCNNSTTAGDATDDANGNDTNNATDDANMNNNGANNNNGNDGSLIDDVEDGVNDAVDDVEDGINDLTTTIILIIQQLRTEMEQRTAIQQQRTMQIIIQITKIQREVPLNKFSCIL